MRVLACRSAFGEGGLGQHFAQLVEESRADGVLSQYYAHTIKPGDEAIGRQIPFVKLRKLKRFTPLRFSPTWTAFVGEEIFDKRIANVLEHKGDRFMGFVGKSFHTFRRAREIGYTSLELIAANSHVRNIQRMHRIAHQDSGRKDTWLNEALARKTMREYELADLIYVHSEYCRESLIEFGVDASKLRKTHLVAHERFKPPATRPDDGLFRIVYIGRLDATKGIVLLKEAFSRLPKNARLTLVGGWGKKSMKRFMQEWMTQDSRVSMAPGDPVPSLDPADVLVHPTYEDGFAYSPVEALACGLPVIVSEDTGMKERIVEGKTGFVIPTGNWEALLERLEYVMDHPMHFNPDAPDASHSPMQAGEEVES